MGGSLGMTKICKFFIEDSLEYFLSLIMNELVIYKMVYTCSLSIKFNFL